MTCDDVTRMMIIVSDCSKSESDVPRWHRGGYGPSKSVTVTVTLALILARALILPFKFKFGVSAWQDV